jgi:hypothetical protein
MFGALLAIRSHSIALLVKLVCSLMTSPPWSTDAKLRIAEKSSRSHERPLSVRDRSAARSEARPRTGNGLDATRTDALLSQLETGKINCVHLPHCGRLAPGAGL